MSDLVTEVATGKRATGGIKSPSFRPRKADGTMNGHSHRKNAAKKKAQYIRNQKARADLYREWQGRNNTPPGSFHERLKALSQGNA